MWECGLKHLTSRSARTATPVTPYVGVWIETMLAVYVTIGSDVTPYVGVWIETLYRIIVMIRVGVTPYVGVWIETMLAV